MLMECYFEPSSMLRYGAAYTYPRYDHPFVCQRVGVCCLRYEDFVRERPWDAGQLDEMVELMVETVCSNRESIRVCGNDLPQAVVKSRLLKLDGDHIRFVFDCLRDNTTQIRNIRQYLLATLYNAPATMESYYAAQVNHDLYSGVA